MNLKEFKFSILIIIIIIITVADHYEFLNIYVDFKLATADAVTVTSAIQSKVCQVE